MRVLQMKAPGATIIVTGIFPRNDNMAVMPTIDKIKREFIQTGGWQENPVSERQRQARRPGRQRVRWHDEYRQATSAIPGYQVWADGLKPIFTELLGPPQKEDHAPRPPAILALVGESWQVGDLPHCRRPGISWGYERLHALAFPFGARRRGTFLGTALHADEGMWTFDNPPTKQLKELYNFTPTQEWLDHVRLSSVRLNDGGSGSFVSPHGLLLTNHHVARGQLQKNSTAQRDYIQLGFYAATSDQEMKSTDLEVNVLVSMENVTDRVQAALKNSKTTDAEFAARKAAIAAIERESQEKTGLRSDVVTLYQGGEYWLYRYKKYTDVRAGVRAGAAGRVFWRRSG